jgi:hypothetical protein
VIGSIRVLKPTATSLDFPESGFALLETMPTNSRVVEFSLRFNTVARTTRFAFPPSQQLLKVLALNKQIQINSEGSECISPIPVVLFSCNCAMSTEGARAKQANTISSEENECISPTVLFSSNYDHDINNLENYSSLESTVCVLEPLLRYRTNDETCFLFSRYMFRRDYVSVDWVSEKRNNQHFSAPTVIDMLLFTFRPRYFKLSTHYSKVYSSIAFLPVTASTLHR